MPPIVILPILGLLPLLGETRLPSARDRWIEVRTDHFTLFGDTSPNRAIEIAQNLERFHALLALVKHEGALIEPLPTKVFVFKQNRAFAPYKWWRGTIERSLQGYVLRHHHGNYIAMNATPRQGDPLGVLYHETIHVYARHNLLGIPLWLEEGLAAIAESRNARYNQAVRLLNEDKDAEARTLLLDLERELDEGPLKRAVNELLGRLDPKP